MSNRQTKGQIIILVMLLLLGLILIFTFFSSFSNRARGAPLVREAYWTVDHAAISTARVGERVEAHVVIEATEEYIGSVVVKIRKDVRWWPDRDYQVATVPIELIGGERSEIEVVFTPDEASTSQMRGYFVEIDFQATRTTWTMENTYPPRLTVNTRTD